MTVLERVTEILNTNEFTSTISKFEYDKAKDKIYFTYKGNRVYFSLNGNRLNGCNHFKLSTYAYPNYKINRITEMEKVESIVNLMIKTLRNRQARQMVNDTEMKPYLIIDTDNGTEKERFLHALSTVDALKRFTQDLVLAQSCTMEFKSIIEL